MSFSLESRGKIAVGEALIERLLEFWAQIDAAVAANVMYPEGNIDIVRSA